MQYGSGGQSRSLDSSYRPPGESHLSPESALTTVAYPSGQGTFICGSEDLASSFQQPIGGFNEPPTFFGPAATLGPYIQAGQDEKIDPVIVRYPAGAASAITTANPAKPVLRAWQAVSTNRWLQTGSPLAYSAGFVYPSPEPQIWSPLASAAALSPDVSGGDTSHIEKHSFLGANHNHFWTYGRGDPFKPEVRIGLTPDWAPDIESVNIKTIAFYPEISNSIRWMTASNWVPEYRDIRQAVSSWMDDQVENGSIRTAIIEAGHLAHRARSRGRGEAKHINARYAAAFLSRLYSIRASQGEQPRIRRRAADLSTGGDASPENRDTPAEISIRLAFHYYTGNVNTPPGNGTLQFGKTKTILTEDQKNTFDRLISGSHEIQPSPSESDPYHKINFGDYELPSWSNTPRKRESIGYTYDFTI